MEISVMSLHSSSSNSGRRERGTLPRRNAAGRPLVSRQTARIPGHRAGGGECPGGRKSPFLFVRFFNLNFVHAYRLTQESNV